MPKFVASKFVASKIVVAGIAGIAALGGLAIVPQMSNAAVTTSYAAPVVAPAPAAAPTYVGFGPGYFAPAFEAGRPATYKTCYMKRSVTFTAEGPKSVTTPTCAP